SVFGLLGNSTPGVSLGVNSDIPDNNPIVQTLSNIEMVELERGSDAELEEKVKEGDLGGFVQIEAQASNAPAPAYAVKLITSDNPTTSATAISIMNGVVDNLNLRLSGVE